MTAIQHPAWCQPGNCKTTGPDVTHQHLIGQTAGVEVWVRRSDSTRPDGSHMFGHTTVHVVSDGAQPLDRDVDVLGCLLLAAEGFADQFEGVR